MRIEAGLTDYTASLSPTGRDLVVIDQPRLPAVVATPVRSGGATAAAAPSRLQDAAAGVDIRNASPRQILDLGLDLHLSGFLEWDEYAMLAFQPDLHPDFNRTIGALTGEKASPDKPRDYLAIWEDRAAFENRYPAKDGSVLPRTERIVNVFRMLDRPMDLVA